MRLHSTVVVPSLAIVTKAVGCSNGFWPGRRRLAAGRLLRVRSHRRERGPQGHADGAADGHGHELPP
jgi:hypothetical protein